MFARGEDALQPPGERPGGLLDSAVGRQSSGAGGQLLYPDPISSAGSLAYGIIKNHPFHNGNKRTALVAMLVHLDKNRYVFREDVDHRNVYEFVKAVAEGSVHRLSTSSYALFQTQPQSDDDDLSRYEVQLPLAIDWIRRRVRKIHRGDRAVTVRQLRKLLANYGFELCDPYCNFADIMKTEERIERGWLGLTTKRIPVRKKVFQIACSGLNQTLQISTIKEIRKRCSLQEEDGVDSEQFYAGADRLDFFLNSYRKILQRLAKE